MHVHIYVNYIIYVFVHSQVQSNLDYPNFKAKQVKVPILGMISRSICIVECSTAFVCYVHANNSLGVLKEHSWLYIALSRLFSQSQMRWNFELDIKPVHQISPQVLPNPLWITLNS